MANINVIKSDALGEAIADHVDIVANSTERKNYEQLIDEANYYTVPRNPETEEKGGEGEERGREISDSTAPRAHEIFASSLQHLLLNPATRWMNIKIKGRDRLPRAWQQWLDLVVGIQIESLTQGGIYKSGHQASLALGVDGTAVVYQEPRPEGGVRVPSFQIQDCYIEQNTHGMVDTVFRRFNHTHRQAMQRFPKAQLPTKQEKPLEFMHASFPLANSDFAHLVDPKIRDLGAEFASIWIDRERKATLAEGFNFEQPYAVSRWYTTRGEVHGRSPAMTVLPDIRMANRLKTAIIRGAEKLVDPPIVVPDGGMLSPIRMFAGGISYSDGQVKVDTLLPPGASRIEVGQGLLEATQDGIKQGMFNHLFITPDRAVLTATQFLGEQGEKERALAPMIIRTQVELLENLVLRNHMILKRQGAFPEPPPDMEGELEVVFVSPLTASLKEAEALAVARLFEGLAPWANVDPGIMDNVETDAIPGIVAGGVGAPSNLLRLETRVDAVREARQEKAEQAAQAEQAQLGFQGAEAAAKMITAQKK